MVRKVISKRRQGKFPRENYGVRWGKTRPRERCITLNARDAITLLCKYVKVGCSPPPAARSWPACYTSMWAAILPRRVSRDASRNAIANVGCKTRTHTSRSVHYLCHDSSAGKSRTESCENWCNIISQLHATEVNCWTLTHINLAVVGITNSIYKMCTHWEKYQVATCKRFLRSIHISVKLDKI